MEVKADVFGKYKRGDHQHFHAIKCVPVLTMLGIIIGISAVITITTIGNSIQTTLTSTLNSLGGNTVQAYVGSRYPEMMQTGIPGNTRK